MAFPEPAGVPRASQTAKSVLRARLVAARETRPSDPAGDGARTAAALELSRFHETVAVYASVAPEPATSELITALHELGIEVLLPLLGREPDWARFAGWGEMTASWRGIAVPTTGSLGPNALTRATMIWCPGLAGSPSGDRLGTGGGWYDRALGWRCPDSIVGLLLYDDEILDDIPTEPHDLKVELILTERRTLDCPLGRPE